MCDRGAETSGVLDYCLRHKIAFIAHGALGGLDARRGKKDVARSFPRLKKVAAEKQVSTYAAALALMRHRWPNLIHITGNLIHITGSSLSHSHYRFLYVRPPLRVFFVCLRVGAQQSGKDSRVFRREAGQQSLASF